MKRIFGSFASCWSCAETASHAILSPSLCQQANSIFAASSKVIPVANPLDQGVESDKVCYNSKHTQEEH